MGEKLETILSEEKWDIDNENKNRVLQSSADLIIYMKKSMKRCMALTKNQAFFNIFSLFRKYLGLYATSLNHRIETFVSLSSPPLPFPLISSSFLCF